LQAVKMKIHMILLVIMLFVFVNFAANAAEYNHHNDDIVNYNITNEKTIVTKQNGTSLGMAASSCDFKTGSLSLQGCAALGSYDDSLSGVVGIGLRTKIGSNPTLLNFKIGRENGENGYSGGANWNF